MPAKAVTIERGQVWYAKKGMAGKGEIPFEILSVDSTGEWWQRSLVARNKITGVEQEYALSEWPNWQSHKASSKRRVCPHCGNEI